MSAFYRRISGSPAVTFPIRNSDFETLFKESPYSQGVCFAFSVLFLKNETLNLFDVGCRERLIGLQQAHEDSVKTESTILTKQNLVLYGLRFVAKCHFESLDIPMIKQTLEQWVGLNKNNYTRVLLSISIHTKDDGVRKHFMPLMFDFKNNKWEVGDTTFALDDAKRVARSALPPMFLELYLRWQSQYVLGYCEANLELTLFQVKLRQ